MKFEAKKILQTGSLLIFILFIIIFAYSRSKDLVFGVKITNVNIVDGTPARTRQNDLVGLAAEDVQSGGKFTDNIINIKGNARNAVNLTLDGRPITIDQQGNFDETIALLVGYNVLNIYARDGFGNSDEKNYQLIY